MNKSQLIKVVAKKAGLTQKETKLALDALTSTIIETLQAGDRVQLVGFGTFSTSDRAERTAINPSTKLPIVISARKVSKFKLSTEVKL